MRKTVCLAHAFLTQCCRSVISFRSGVVEVVGLLLLVLHTQRQVTTGQQVIQGFHGIPRYLLVVVVLGVSFSYAPQGTAAVVVIDFHGLPGIFVNVEVTLGVDEIG